MKHGLRCTIKYSTPQSHFVNATQHKMAALLTEENLNHFRRQLCKQDWGTLITFDPTSPERLQRALRPVLSTVHHVHRPSPNTSQHHPFPHLAQPWARLDLTPIQALRILRSTPQDLPCRTCSGPYLPVHVDGVGLLAPHVNLTAQNKVGGVLRDVGQRVVGVYEAPVLGWGTVIRERVMFLERGGVEVEPLAFAAVEVLRKVQ